MSLCFDWIKANLDRNQKEFKPECDISLLRQPIRLKCFHWKFWCSMKFLGHICLPFNNSASIFYFNFSSRFCCQHIFFCRFYFVFVIFAHYIASLCSDDLNLGKHVHICMRNVLMCIIQSFLLLLFLLLLIDPNWLHITITLK